MAETFDNKDRSRYYGLRIGDIINLKGVSGDVVYYGAEVIDYGADNNRVEVRLKDSSETDWVAEWCDIITKVEDRNKDIEIIEKLARELSMSIDKTGDIETLQNFGSLGLLTCKELMYFFYNYIKKELK